jgi:hypothetical protein
MAELLQSLWTLLATWVIGDVIYGVLVNLMMRSIGRHLSRKWAGMFQFGLTLVGLRGLLGDSVTGLGLTFCIIAILFDAFNILSDSL